MKTMVKGLCVAAFAAVLVFALVVCEEPDDSSPPATKIDIAAIQGVTVPANGGIPVRVITENAQYSGTVTWSGNPSTFAPLTEYTATIKLTAKTGYTFKKVAANFFTVAGATSVSNAVSSGVITAVFPMTDSRLVTGIGVNKQPNKLTYAQGDALNLSGLEVTLTYSNGTRDNITAEYFQIKSIITDPAEGEKLDYLTHNGQPIKITYGKINCETRNLDINTPTADDFNISGLTQNYDGSPKTVTITPKEGKSNGTITIKYNGSTTVPLNLGTYTVTFDVAATTNFNAASGLSAGTLTIKGTPTADDFNISELTQNYDGSPKTVTIMPKVGKSTGTITVKYNGSTTAPSEVNTYTVTFDVAATTNYNAVNGLSAGILTIYKKIEMILIPAGSFQMGNPDTSMEYTGNERPVHTVTLSSFYMGKYEVTQEQWAAIMGSNPSYFTDSPATGEVQSKRPVERVSWYDTFVFCNKLSMKEGLSPAYRISGSTDPAVWGTVPTSSNSTWDAVEIVAGSNGYRLPTEAQWEYAARGGNGSPGNYTYSGSNNVDDVAWYWGNSGEKTHEVGKKAPNGLGLYDMSGNVYEWCWDWFDDYYYSSSPANDPRGAAAGSLRVLRGGCRHHNASLARSSFRYNQDPPVRYDGIGFRLIRP